MAKPRSTCRASVQQPNAPSTFASLPCCILFRALFHFSTPASQFCGALYHSLRQLEHFPNQALSLSINGEAGFLHLNRGFGVRSFAAGSASSAGFQSGRTNGAQTIDRATLTVLGHVTQCGHIGFAAYTGQYRRCSPTAVRRFHFRPKPASSPPDLTAISVPAYSASTNSALSCPRAQATNENETLLPPGK
jgi:hypothetical protein